MRVHILDRLDDRQVTGAATEIAAKLGPDAVTVEIGMRDSMS